MRAVFLHTANTVLGSSMSDRNRHPHRRAAARASYRAGARAMLPLAPAVTLFAASFGVLARSAGFDPAATVAMSATTFAGSAQFAAVSVLAAGGTAIAAVVAAVLLNARYAPMCLAAARE